MFSIKLRPRGYRVQRHLRVNNATGGPEYVWHVQVNTRLGWSTIYTFHNEQEAHRICAEWRETLND